MVLHAYGLAGNLSHVGVNIHARRGTDTMRQAEIVVTVKPLANLLTVIIKISWLGAWIHVRKQKRVLGVLVTQSVFGAMASDCCNILNREVKIKKTASVPFVHITWACGYQKAYQLILKPFSTPAIQHTHNANANCTLILQIVCVFVSMCEMWMGISC